MTKTAMRLARESLAAGNWKMALEEYAKLEKEGSAKEETELAVGLCNFAIAIEKRNYPEFEAWIAKFGASLKSHADRLDPAFAEIMAQRAAKALLSPCSSHKPVKLDFDEKPVVSSNQNAVLFVRSYCFESREIAMALRGYLLDYVMNPGFSDVSGERQMEILEQCADLDKFLLNTLNKHADPEPVLVEKRMKAVYKALGLADPRLLYAPFYKKAPAALSISCVALFIGMLALMCFYEFVLK